MNNSSVKLNLNIQNDVVNLNVKKLKESDNSKKIDEIYQDEKEEEVIKENEETEYYLYYLLANIFCCSNYNKRIYAKVENILSLDNYIIDIYGRQIYSTSIKDVKNS